VSGITWAEIARLSRHGAWEVSPEILGNHSRSQSTSSIELEQKEADGSGFKGEDAMAVISQSEYPTGFRLTCIMVALVLAVFLVSLDMVSLLIPKKYSGTGRTETNM
jgi:hypothetical protein